MYMSESEKESISEFRMPVVHFRSNHVSDDVLRLDFLVRMRRWHSIYGRRWLSNSHQLRLAVTAIKCGADEDSEKENCYANEANDDAENGPPCTAMHHLSGAETNNKINVEMRHTL